MAKDNFPRRKPESFPQIPETDDPEVFRLPAPRFLSHVFHLVFFCPDNDIPSTPLSAYPIQDTTEEIFCSFFFCSFCHILSTKIREDNLSCHPLLLCGEIFYFNLEFLCTCAKSFISFAFSKTASVIWAPPKSLASSRMESSPSRGWISVIVSVPS